LRDLTLEVVMSSGLTMNIPAFLRYDLRLTDGQWKVAALRAYWELGAMVGVMLRQGVKSVPTSVELSATLLRNQGLRGAAGFASGLRGAGRRKKRIVESYLSKTDDDQLRGARASKVIGAGDTVAAAITTPSGRGVLFCEIPSAAKGISSMRYFRER
jgi:hypothetical protein